MARSWTGWSMSVTRNTKNELPRKHLPELDIAIHTGLRRSEQYRLTWDCVDIERKVLVVPQTKNGD